jgi:hypothetical protein
MCHHVSNDLCLICPQPTSTFLQGGGGHSANTGSSGSYPGVPIFLGAVQLSTGLRGGNLYSPAPTTLLSLSYSEPHHMSQYPHDRSVLFGRPYTKLWPQNPVWLYVSRTRTQEVPSSFLSRPKLLSPLDIQSDGIISYPPHRSLYMHLEVSVRLILCRRSFVGMRSLMPRNRIALIFSEDQVVWRLIHTRSHSTVQCRITIRIFLGVDPAALMDRSAP